MRVSREKITRFFFFALFFFPKTLVVSVPRREHCSLERERSLAKKCPHKPQKIFFKNIATLGRQKGPICPLVLCFLCSTTTWDAHFFFTSVKKALFDPPQKNNFVDARARDKSTHARNNNNNNTTTRENIESNHGVTNRRLCGCRRRDQNRFR